MNLAQALKLFRLSEFRPMQEEVIKSVIARRDTLLIAPTGCGKSLCYQLPSQILPGLTVVVSPLISLQKDQVDSLNEIGISADYINSSITKPAEKREIARRLHSGKTKILYIAPERLSSRQFVSFIKKLNISLLAVDEAHLIFQQGHQFRPDYRLIHRFREICPSIPCIAVTATATPIVSDDIVNQLKMKNPDIFQSSFDRPNLYIEVVRSWNRDSQIIDIIGQNKHKGSTIIYCIAKKESESIANTLRESGFPAKAYHAGLKNGERIKTQDDFMSGNIKTIVATTAFGMGIDKPDVRLVINATVSKTMENSYQEGGRAGRDRKHAKWITLYDELDVGRWEFIIRISTEDKNGNINYDERNKQLRMLYQVADYCESDVCRRKQILAYFGEDYQKDNCGKCDVCI